MILVNFERFWSRGILRCKDFGITILSDYEHVNWTNSNHFGPNRSIFNHGWRWFDVRWKWFTVDWKWFDVGWKWFDLVESRLIWLKTKVRENVLFSHVGLIKSVSFEPNRSIFNHGWRWFDVGWRRFEVRSKWFDVGWKWFDLDQNWPIWFMFIVIENGNI